MIDRVIARDRVIAVIGKAKPHHGSTRIRAGNKTYRGFTRIKEIARIAKIAKIAEIENQKPLKHRGTEEAEG